MPTIDWQKLYASNRAAIERAGVMPRSSPAPDTPSGWHERTFTVAGRTRRALVHPPAGIAPETAVPLVCMLHGCTQDAATFATATLMSEVADRHGFLAVFPEQTRGENPQGCWNWFLPEHQARGAGEPASIAGVVRELLGTSSPWAIDTRRVFVAGFSAGGAMAAVLAATYPDLFAGLAVHSGLAYGSATSLGAAFTAMARGAGNPLATHARLEQPVPSIVIHGTADTTVAPINAQQVLQQSMAAERRSGSEPTHHQADGGHAYARHQWTDHHGTVVHELLMVDALGHAWSGGKPGGSYTDARGPNAGEAIARFFEQATNGARGSCGPP
jgi:poly(hydroxyalkanoate) depolymerase family esterase